MTGRAVSGEDARPRRVAFLAHCLLNQNAKVEEGAKTPAMWRPVLDLLRERGYAIRQMPCPELAFAGARRFWMVREQFDTPLYRRHCRRLARLVATLMEPHLRAGDDVVLVGLDSSPSMGVDFTLSGTQRGGRPAGDDDWTPVPGEGIFLEELHAELAERGLPAPRATGIRHWFPGYDPEEERRRLEELLS
jgi:predicted secreted protein